MPSSSSRTALVFITAACFLSFFVFGYTDNLKGPTLPSVLAELHIGYGTGGNIFFGQSLGFLISTLAAGLLADRFGLKATLALSGLLLLLGVAAYSLLASPPALAAALFTLGLGFGTLELGANAVIAALFSARKGLFLNWMHLLYGMGAMIAPLLAGLLLARGTYWRFLYRWDLLLVALMVLAFLLMPLSSGASASIGRIQLKDIPRFAFRGRLPWYYLAIGLYVSVEVGMGAWLVTYLQQGQAASITASNQALSLYFGTLMLGRFLGGFVVHRIGYLRSVQLASLGVAACLALGLLGPSPLRILLPVTGLFLSIVFPTLTAAVSDAHREHSNTILGMLFAFAGLGGLVGPWLVAWGSELLGIQTGFSVNLGLALLLIAAASFLTKGPKNEATTA